MGKIAAVLDRLVREATRVDPEFTLRPETPERIEAAERCMGERLPDGYREFLERIGRTKWPHAIGNVVDHRTTDVSARFVPFGRRAGHEFDVCVFVRRRTPAPKPDVRAEIEGTIAARRAAIAKEEDEERIEEWQREIADLEDELAELDDKPISSRDGAAKHVPIEWCEREHGTLASAPQWDVTGPWETDDSPQGAAISAQPFADWLDAAITLAIAPGPTRPRAASVDEDTERTRRLLEILVEAGAIEVVENFDDLTAALQLAPFYGDSEKFHAELLDCPGVEEVFLSEDDLEIRFDTSAP